MAKGNKPPRNQQNQLRIIGGENRGRKLNFPDLPGLRPTSDRIRETLFNWLQMDIVGAQCLDLFAGSGALGFEALSRGAKQVDFVDSQSQAIEYLKINARELKIENAQFHLMQADIFLNSAKEAKCFDLVFLDPPFHENLLTDCLTHLLAYSVLAQDAKIYVETEAALDDSVLSDKWEILKSKIAGNVHYYLLSYS